MKKLLFLFLMTPLLMLAQEGKGIHFEDGLSWSAIQAKAKAENKYIFMDCFTTWCGPCKFMAAQVFPQEASGKYFNDKFISVSVQLDTSKADNAAVKSWYADAHALMEQYHVRAYPTFLVFSPDGRPVHRLVGSSETPEVFNGRVAESFEPNKQYYTLLDQYQKGRKDSGFLHKLAAATWGAYDKQNGYAVSAAYLATQQNLYTKENLEFINSYVENTTDPGFEVYLKDPARADKILGEGKAEEKVVQVVIYSELRPLIVKAGAATPDWAGLQKELKRKYPLESAEIFAQGKVMYFQQKNDWPGFQQAIIAYMDKYGAHSSPEALNEYAWTVFQHCPDMTCVGEALEWSKRSFKDQPNPAFMDTYANILYKMGKKDDAIVWEEKAVSMVPDAEKSTYQQTLDKMKKGEKTWD